MRAFSGSQIKQTNPVIAPNDILKLTVRLHFEVKCTVAF